MLEALSPTRHIPRAQEVAAVVTSITIVRFIKEPAETRNFLSPEVPWPPPAWRAKPSQQDGTGPGHPRPVHSPRGQSVMRQETQVPPAARGAAETGAGLGGKLQRSYRFHRRRRERRAPGWQGLGTQGQPASLRALARAPHALWAPRAGPAAQSVSAQLVSILPRLPPAPWALGSLSGGSGPGVVGRGQGHGWRCWV